jgi:hypothetical protein
VLKNRILRCADDDEEQAVYCPNPGALVPQVEDEAGPSRGDPAAAAGGVYCPPKLTPMAMEEPAPRGRALQEERRARAQRRIAVNNQFVRDLEAEIEGAPEELRQAGGGAAEDSLAFLKERQKLEARARVEEDLMARCPALLWILALCCGVRRSKTGSLCCQSCFSAARSRNH